MCKKRKLNISVNDYTYPNPNKAIQQNKIELNINFNLKVIQENISKESCNKKMLTNNSDVSNNINKVSNDHIIMKTIHQNTKDDLGITA